MWPPILSKIVHGTLFIQEARCGKSEKTPLWDERIGQCLADFANNIRADSQVVEMKMEEARRLTTSEIFLLCQANSDV